jgi:cobaltochelatase CobS
MGADFYVVAKCEGAHDVLGFIDAAGNYHSTGFRKAWEFGGLVLLDEVDAFDAGATLAFNGALDGGICAFPDRQVERHADCYVVATANTWGLGANSDYVGRNKLDGAFIDRFHMRLVWQYDVALEIAISGNEGWARRVIAARERAKQAAVKVPITPRATQGGAALIAAGYSEDEAAEFTYLANLSKEQRKMVEGA